MKLKCIDDSRNEASKFFTSWVEEGVIYTLLREEGALNGEKRVLLKELRNPKVFVPELNGNFEVGFAKRRFVEVDELGLEIHEEETEKIAA